MNNGDSPSDNSENEVTGSNAGELNAASNNLDATIAPTPTPNAMSDATIAPAQSGTNLILGKEIGDYDLIEEIARGGMGVVYKARHRNLNRLAAVKMILGGRFSSPEEIQRFRIEAESAAKLDHPGIVPIYELQVA